MVLNSLHKYQPRIHIVRIDSSSSSSSSSSLPLPETGGSSSASSPKLTDALCVLSKTLIGTGTSQTNLSNNNANNELELPGNEFHLSTASNASNVLNPIHQNQHRTNKNSTFECLNPECSNQLLMANDNMDDDKLLTAAAIAGGADDSCIDTFCGGNKIVTYTFKETQFIAVTAYQNEDVCIN